MSPTELTDIPSSGGALGRAAEGARQALLERIQSRELRAGQRLGTERELADELGVSRFALRQALASLEAAGTPRRVPGRGGGTFVRHASKVERDVSTVVSVPAYLRAQGFVAGTLVLSAAIKEAGELTRRHLDLEPGALVVDLVRIRLADGSPLSLEHARLPADMFPGLLELPLGSSNYDLFRKHYDIVAAEAIEQLELATATVDEASLLGLTPDTPLFSVMRVARTADGRLFEFSRDLFRADRTRVVVRSQGAGSLR